MVRSCALISWDGIAMNELFYLIPISVILGIFALCAFFWAHDSGQFEDMDGAAERLLLDDEDRPRND